MNLFANTTKLNESLETSAVIDKYFIKFIIYYEILAPLIGYLLIIIKQLVYT